MMIRFAAVCSAALGACLAFGQGHYVEYGVNLSVGEEYIEEYAQGEQATGPLDFTASVPDFGSVHGIANVGYGVNKAFINLQGTNASNPLDFAYGFATSRYFDMLQFDDPELNGTEGTFTANLFVEGSGQFNASPELISSPDTQLDGFWHAVINVEVEGITDEFGDPIQSGFYAGEWLKDYGETALLYDGDPLNTYTTEVTFRFIYGQPIFLDTFLQTFISIDNQESLIPGTIDATIDLGNTAYWGGIKNVRDANGNLVTDFDLSSSSGFDYLSAPVPEPASMIALGGGGLGLLLRLRRKG